MTISMWTLVDKQGRMYYTGETKKMVEDYLNLLENKADLKIVEVKNEV